MFILNQQGTVSIRVETINKIMATTPRYNEFIPPEANAKKGHIVIALTEHGEEILGAYESVEDCKIVMNYVSFLINNKAGNIYMPKKEEAKIIAGKLGAAKTKRVADLAKEILESIQSTSPGQKGGIR